MAVYKHGVYVTEQPTGVVAPVQSTAGLQVVIGTAPINRASDPYHCTNTPMLANTLKGATAAVGYSNDYDKYTICQSMGACFKVMGVAPVILINVLDPNKHKKDMAETTVQVNSGVATVEQKDILLDKLVVKSASTTLTAGTDYTAAFDDDGYVTIAIIPGGKAASATSLTVSGVQIDPDAVTAADIVGGVNAKGVETGMEVIRQIYPALNMTPGILLAPGWSENATVAAGLQAKTGNINGVFRAVCIVDIDSSATGATTYTEVKQQKEKQAVTSPNCYPVWLYAKVGDVVYAGSAMAAALTVATDAANGDIPYVSPSNKTLAISAACLKDGTEVLLDQEQANVVNSFGVATWLNMNGFRLWGNNTACYPGNTDPKDRWFSVRRFMSWDDNTFIQTYFQKVDDPLNKRLIEALVDSENVRGNSFVSRGISPCSPFRSLRPHCPWDPASQGHGTLPQPGPAYPGKRNGRPACGAFSCCRDAPGERSPEQKRPDPENLLPWQPCTGPRLPECCKDHFPIRLPERKAG